MHLSQATPRHIAKTLPPSPPVALRATLVGSVAALAVFGALGGLARREGRGALAPVNATAHVLHGPRAGAVETPDLAHTAVGAGVNHGASIFWALPYTWWLSRRGYRSVPEVVLGAAATAAIAGAVDYGLVPRRLSPGWEHALPPRGVAAGFAALGLGLALGALVTRGPGGR